VSAFDFTERPLAKTLGEASRNGKAALCEHRKRCALRTPQTQRSSALSKKNTGPPVKSKEHMRNQLQTELRFEMSFNVFVLS